MLMIYMDKIDSPYGTHVRPTANRPAVMFRPFSRLSFCPVVRYHAALDQRANNPLSAANSRADHMSSQKDQYKEKFRPDSDSALERELSAALGEVSLEKLYGFDKPQEKQSESSEQLAAKGLRKGKVVSIGKDDVFVDLGGKSQGIASLTQFDEVPTVGQEVEFHVERYDPREGLLILTRRGAVATNISWHNLEIGQLVEGTVTGMNKGGLELQVKNMRAFMPAGQVDIVFHKDISTFIGQRLTAEVTQ